MGKGEVLVTACDDRPTNVGRDVRGSPADRPMGGGPGGGGRRQDGWRLVLTC